MDLQYINRLPPELLAAIATFIDQSMIFRLATVCRCWHDVFTGTPTLWTSIDCRSESRTSILLERSKSSPIDVTINHLRFAQEAVSLVANHTHRMRSIDVALSARQFEDIRSFLNGLAPILETMRMQERVDLMFMGPVQSFPLYSSFFQGQFPALRTLHLEGYPFDPVRSVPMMTNGLTTLVLADRRPHHLRNLLEYLEHGKNLKYLRVDLPILQGTAPASRIVSLPNFQVRERAVLNIPLRTRNRTAGSPPADMWARDGLLQIFESRAIKDIQIAFYGSRCIVGLSGSHLRLVELTEAHHSGSASFHSDCLDSFQSLPIATTEVLTFTHSPQDPSATTFTPQSCTRLLLQMPALWKITLDTLVAPCFIRALEPDDGDVPCPRLRVLAVIQRVGHEVDVRGILFALSNQRKDLGHPLVWSVPSDRSF